MITNTAIEDTNQGMRVTYENVTKRFGEVTAVDSLDLTIDESEFLVLLGPSGCGKTTSLRMLAGLEGISSGTIRIGDTVVNDLPPRSRNIAMVFMLLRRLMSSQFLFLLLSCRSI